MPAAGAASLLAVVVVALEAATFAGFPAARKRS